MDADEKTAAILKATTQLQEVLTLLDTLKEEYPELYTKIAELEKLNQELAQRGEPLEAELEQLKAENEQMKTE